MGINKKRNIVIAIVLVVIVILFVVFINTSEKQSYVPAKTIDTNPLVEEFVGSNSCIECHEDIVKSHSETAHFKTSSFSNKNTIKGSFSKGENEFRLNDDIHFKMVSNGKGQFQEAHSTKTKQRIYALKFDINIGSGTKGQSYLTWINGGLYQQQISYYTPTDSWINSPMYPKGKFVKPRPIIPQCIGCHVTYAKPLSNQPYENRYKKNSFVLGVDCERCHGPAGKHVSQMKKKKYETNKTNIVKFSTLNRQQKLDACAVCHSGLNDRTEHGILKYVTGDALKNDTNSTANNKELDVHGNQYGLLIQSKCFKKSEKMNCFTCHDVHKNERGKIDTFSNRCINCHTINSLSTNSFHKNKKGEQDCINCHMPNKASKALLLNINEGDTLMPLMVRSHLIGIYNTNKDLLNNNLVAK